MSEQQVREVEVGEQEVREEEVKEQEVQELEATAQDGGTIEAAAGLEGPIIAALHTCFDPEIPVDIYELGLIYGIDIQPSGDVNIKMTLTSPGCPV
ncbi:MAG TPA: iron-sulfur cluster assembly protein, partial [Blastocatellia bacterium]|nr:iron-sulfur cluster assembly protein [Blastocatellia bacterium]